MTALDIHPIAGALGAEVSGVDLAQALDASTVAAIRRAWLEHLVLFFRDQRLSPARFLAFGRRFGEPIEYPGHRRLMHRITLAGDRPRGISDAVPTSATAAVIRGG